VTRLEQMYKKTLLELVLAQARQMDPKKHDIFLAVMRTAVLHCDILELWHWAKAVGHACRQLQRQIA
jgi:hypothetical protein